MSRLKEKSLDSAADHALERHEIVSHRDRVKVCFLIDDLDIGGTEKHLLALIRELDRTTIDPLLVLLRGETDRSKNLEPSECEVIRLGVRSFLMPSVVTRSMRFIRVLRDRKIDVLQMYFPDSTLFGAICGKLAGVRHLIRTRRNAGYWMTLVHRLRGRLISMLVSSTIVNSEASKQSVIEQERASSNSVVLIPNGVQLNRFPVGSGSRASKAESGYGTVGMLANLRPVKRIEDFLYAARVILDRRQNCRFEIAGEGPSRNELQRLIDKLKIGDQVKLIGAVTDVAGFLPRMDVVVSCSASEGLSNSLLEAMACALPIVATDAPGVGSVIEHGNNGFLYPVGDVQRLADYIMRLLDDAALARSLGETGRQIVSDQFDQREMVKRYEHMYYELAGCRRERHRDS